MLPPATTATAARNGIYAISSADGSGLTRVTSNPIGGHDIPGSYSPDGGRIVFLRSDANMHSAGMFVVKTTDGQLRQILPECPYRVFHLFTGDLGRGRTRGT